MNPIKSLAAALHAQEDALFLLISILAGYPLAVIYRLYVYKESPRFQHLFIVTVGITLYICNYGFAVIHSLLSITVAYLIVTYFPGTQLSVVLAHVAFLGHLLIGYSYAETDHYDINWTTPFCMMTLRFIGLVMDVYDGHKPKDKLKPDQIERGIRRTPGFLETAAFGYFFCGTFVGPFFSLARFRAFINGEFLDEKKEVRTSGLMPSLGRFVAGCFYAVIHQWGLLWIPSDYFNSAQFFVSPIHWKVIWITLWFRFMMSRYVCSWLFTEGAAILCGFAYNGKNDKGEDRWDGVRDVHIIGWELGMDFQSVVDSFNVGTNTFAKNHIYRRLKWLGNRLHSHLATLIYLAVWHGYHLGYFVLFIFEFSCVLAQKQLYSLLERVPEVTRVLSYPYMYPLKVLFGRIVINVSMGIGFLTFGMVKTRMWIKPLSSVYFFPHVFYMIVWPILHRILDGMLPRKQEKSLAAKSN